MPRLVKEIRFKMTFEDGDAVELVFVRQEKIQGLLNDDAGSIGAFLRDIRDAERTSGKEH